MANRTNSPLAGFRTRNYDSFRTRKPGGRHEGHRLFCVSTQEQASEGVSLEAQEAKLRAYAALYELELVDVVSDAGQSAKTLERPGLQQVLGALDACQPRGYWWPSSTA